MSETKKETEEVLSESEIVTEIPVVESQAEMIEKEKYVRLYSEFENFKKRTQKEKEDYLKTANQKMALEIIPSLDNFERAGKLETGIQLIYDGLKKTLERNGVKEVDAKGLDFNADTMEALTQISVDDEMKGKVVDVIEKGYELNGKIIRFAKVVVGA